MVSSKGNYSTMTVEKIGECVVEELKKVRISLFAYNFLRDLAIRGAILRSLERDMLSRQKGASSQADTNNLKEVLLSKTRLRNYALAGDPQGWEAKEILMLHDMPKKMTHKIVNTGASVE